VITVRDSAQKRLFILGLDGSPLPLLRQLMQEGDLPNLSRLFEKGSAVEMSSSLPDVSAVAWTSVNTGMNPAKHGIYGFIDRKPGTDSIEVMTATHVRAKTIWELVSEGGRRAVAINVPLSFPPQRINGVVISDFLAPSLDRAVFPASLFPTLKSMDYRIDTDPWQARQSLDAFIDDFTVTAQKRAEAVLYLMEREAWDLFMVVFMETDRLHHFMWQYLEDQDSPYEVKFREAYRLIDGLAGKIIDKLDPEDALILMSDHGFTSLRKEVYLNVWLEEQGYLRFLPNRDKGLDAISPESRAFSLDPGRIYLNLQGREPRGSVSAAESAGLLTELIMEVKELRDPESNDLIVREVYPRDEIYDGPYLDRAPDLLVMSHDGFDIKGTFESDALTGRGKLVGMHKYDNATLFVRDRQIVVGHASVHDVLPTACALMSLPCPPEVDGKIVVSN
jgi:predicted AlkP superfamily phosphohydrolase/phosphomutase